MLSASTRTRSKSPRRTERSAVSCCCHSRSAGEVLDRPLDAAAVAEGRGQDHAEALEQRARPPRPDPAGAERRRTAAARRTPSRRYSASVANRRPRSAAYGSMWNGDLEVVVAHDVHDAVGGPILVAVGAPPAQVDGADAAVRDPARVLLEDRARPRVVGAEQGHVRRGQIGRRRPVLRVPVAPGIAAVPGVVLEDESPAQVRKPRPQATKSGRGRRRRPRKQQGGRCRQAGAQEPPPAGKATLLPHAALPAPSSPRGSWCPPPSPSPPRCRAAGAA